MPQVLIIWLVKHYKVLIFAATTNKKIQNKSHYLSVVIFVLGFDNINGSKAMGMDKICINLWKPT